MKNCKNDPGIAHYQIYVSVAITYGLFVTATNSFEPEHHENLPI